MASRGRWHTFTSEQLDDIKGLLDQVISNAPDKDTVRIARKLRNGLKATESGTSLIQIIDPEEEAMLNEVVAVLSGPPEIEGGIEYA